MKARVYKSDGWWYGEVYANWLIGGEEWRDVTSNCFTRIGATLSLKHWLSQHKVYEVKVK